MTRRRFMEQLKQLQGKTGLRLAAGPDDSPRFIYEKGHVLVHEKDHPHVLAALQHEFGRLPSGTERVSSLRPMYGYPVRAIKVGDGAEGGDLRDPEVDRALLCVRDKFRAEQEIISRRHLVTITPNACPADEPSPPYEGETINPRRAEGDVTDSAVSVLVVDTGLLPDWKKDYWWHENVVEGQKKPDPFNPMGDVLMYVGHGTFITGLIATVARNTKIRVSAALNAVENMREDVFGAKLLSTVTESGWPDIISLSAGTSNGSPEELLGLRPFMDALAGENKTVLVAAAGNNGRSDRFWPAAYADHQTYGSAVVSVGALRFDGNAAACFTDFGPWVKVYAPGERLVGSFAGADEPRHYTYQHSTFNRCQFHFDYYPCTCKIPSHDGALTDEDPTTVTFNGLAKWSGTSFATPLVAALIAQYMTDHPGTSSRTAAAKVLETTEHAHVHGRAVPAVFPPTWESQ